MAVVRDCNRASPRSASTWPADRTAAATNRRLARLRRHASTAPSSSAVSSTTARRAAAALSAARRRRHLGSDVAIATAAFSDVPGDDARSFHRVGVIGAVDVYLAPYSPSPSPATTRRRRARRRSPRARLRALDRPAPRHLRLDLGGDVIYDRQIRQHLRRRRRPPRHAPAAAAATVASASICTSSCSSTSSCAGRQRRPRRWRRLLHRHLLSGWRLGLTWGGGGGGAIDPPQLHDIANFNLRVGLTYWLTRSWNASLPFIPSWSPSDVGGAFDQRVLLAIVARIG